MKLVNSILCLNCEEVHDNPRKCPSCATDKPGFRIARVIEPMDDAERQRIRQTSQLLQINPDAIVAEIGHDSDH